jgi:chemotaxis response regulator CheB
MHPPNDDSAPGADSPSPLEKNPDPVEDPGGSTPGEFFVVGIGASAGALEPISELLKHLPRGSNFAAVLVQHLDPHHDSVLVDLLNRVSNMPVQWAANGRSVAPGQV